MFDMIIYTSDISVMACKYIFYTHIIHKAYTNISYIYYLHIFLVFPLLWTAFWPWLCTLFRFDDKSCFSQHNLIFL